MKTTDVIPLEEQIKLLAKLKKYLNDQHTATLLSLGISGSHLYGFNSPDSDIDLRGIAIVNTHGYLGLNRPMEQLQLKEGNMEIVIQEIGKMTSLALKSNCTILEQIETPQIYSTKEFLEWKPLVMEKMSKDGLYHSYKGMAMFNYHKFIKSGKKKSVKKYLYVTRALLSGRYALDNHSIQANMQDLGSYYHLLLVKQLIKAKKIGTEEGQLPAKVKEADLDTLIVDLMGKLDKAYVSSTLPEKASHDDWKEMNEWLIKMRKKYLV